MNSVSDSHQRQATCTILNCHHTSRHLYIALECRFRTLLDCLLEHFKWEWPWRDCTSFYFIKGCPRNFEAVMRCCFGSYAANVPCMGVHGASQLTVIKKQFLLPLVRSGILATRATWQLC